MMSKEIERDVSEIETGTLIETRENTHHNVAYWLRGAEMWMRGRSTLATAVV